MISARINIERGWGDAMARRIEAQVPRLLVQSLEEGAKVASEASRSRRRTGRMAEMEILGISPTPRGFTGAFKSRAFYAGFQSKGTSKGLTGLGFLEKGRSAARKTLVTGLNRLR